MLGSHFLYKSMRAVDLIRKKRDSGNIPSRRFSSSFPATPKATSPTIRCRVADGRMDSRLEPAELAALTEVMLHSGEVVSHADIPGKKVDKHSTGGVGDKTP